MTHSLYFCLVTKDFEKVEYLKDSLLSSDEFLDLYNLVKTGSWCDVCQRKGYQPFIAFPENKKDTEDWGKSDYYNISIQSGNHVAEYDTLEALHWFHFTVAFKHFFEEELKGFKMFYHLEQDDEKLTEKQMFKLIIGGDKK